MQALNRFAWRQALTGAFVAALIAAAAVGLAAPRSTAQEGEGSTTWLGAQSKVEAAVALSQETFPNGAVTILLGRDDTFGDSVASGGAQGRLAAPLLLTDRVQLSQATFDEIERLGGRTIFVLGGTAAVSDEIVEQLQSSGYLVTRLSGATRILTAIDIAGNVFPGATTAVLVRAFGTPEGDETQGFADSLPAGGFAAFQDIPVLLTDSAELSPEVATYLADNGFTEVFIIGGETAVSAAVQTALEDAGIMVTRLSGANRFATAVAVANARGFDDASTADGVLLVEGQADGAYAPGFAAAALSGASGTPILLSTGDTVPVETTAFLDPADGEAALVCAPLTTRTACDAAAESMGNAAVDCSGVEPESTATPTATPTETETENGGILPLPTDILGSETETETETEAAQEGDDGEPRPGHPCRSGGSDAPPLPLPVIPTGPPGATETPTPTPTAT